MLKKNERFDPNSCLNRAREEERIFVLLGRDEAAPRAIRDWVRERLRLGKNTMGDPQITEALDCAEKMVAERLRDLKTKEALDRAEEMERERSSSESELYYILFRGKFFNGFKIRSRPSEEAPCPEYLGAQMLVLTKLDVLDTVPHLPAEVEIWGLRNGWKYHIVEGNLLQAEEKETIPRV